VRAAVLLAPALLLGLQSKQNAVYGIWLYSVKLKQEMR
jgi:hypothetical protein